jgi:DNA-binding GntR family transcriptional regulator
MSIQNIKEVQRKNLVFDVAALLRDSIAKGDLPPGTHLVEQDVSQQLGVSRGPLREALRVLETEGLVRSYPGRGSFVSFADNLGGGSDPPGYKAGKFR